MNLTGRPPGPSGEVRRVTVPASLAGERLDRAVALLVGVSRSQAAELLDQGRVRLDGELSRVRHRILREGQALEVLVPPAAASPTGDPAVTFGVVLEDPEVLVVDKPAGVAVHPGAGRAEGTLVQGLLARYPELADLPRAGAGEPQRPGIVHRLDRDTSGLLLVARTPRAFHVLTEALREHTVQRTYLALVHGHPEDRGLVDAPIGRSVRQPERMAVRADGRPARSAFEVLGRFEHPRAAALLRVELETGRTHQIRVHLAAIGHPVVGDRRYGRAEDEQVFGAPRQWLHAAELRFSHPVDQQPVACSSPLPADLAAVLALCSPGPPVAPWGSPGHDQPPGPRSAGPRRG